MKILTAVTICIMFTGCTQMRAPVHVHVYTAPATVTVPTSGALKVKPK